MNDPISIALIASTVVLVIGLSCLAGLKGWSSWLDYKRLELASHTGEAMMPRTGGRIEIADLKERVRKLEAIAAGIDL